MTYTPNTFHIFESKSSSSDELHRMEVFLGVGGNRLMINCACDGAVKSQTICKHAKAILELDGSMFHVEDHVMTLQEMADDIRASELFASYARLNDELDRIADDKKQKDAEAKALKHAFFRQMSRGS